MISNPRPFRLGSFVFIAALILSVVGCDQQSSSSPKQAQAQTPKARQGAGASTTTPKENPTMPTAAAPEGSATLRGVTAQPSRRPPKSDWLFDLTLQNDTDQARWYLIADPFEHSLADERQAPGVAVFEAEGGVRYLRFSSTNNVLAIHVPAKSKLDLDGLKLRCWTEQCPANLEVWASPTLTVSGKPVADGWLQGQKITNPAGEQHAQLKGAKKVFNHLNKDFKNEPVAYQPAAKWSLAHETASPWGGGVSPEANETMRKAAEGAEPQPR